LCHSAMHCSVRRIYASHWTPDAGLLIIVPFGISLRYVGPCGAPMDFSILDHNDWNASRPNIQHISSVNLIFFSYCRRRIIIVTVYM